jgi:hypothetical protein
VLRFHKPHLLRGGPVAHELPGHQRLLSNAREESKPPNEKHKLPRLELEGVHSHKSQQQKSMRF